MNFSQTVSQSTKMAWWWMSLVLSIVMVMALSSLTVNAQFVSGSDESDGVLDFTGLEPDTTVKFNPADFDPPLDSQGDNVYHFTTITIPEGVTVRLSADILGTKPVIWLATGAVVVNGIIDLDGQRGHNHNEVRLPAIAGAGGHGGGVGAAGASGAFPGDGPGAGKVGQNAEDTDRGDSGGAGHATAGQGAIAENLAGPAYGNNFLLPLLGGSGGAGGIVRRGLNAGGGGAGGGAFLLASNTSIALNGEIRANGGVGGDGNSNEGGGGSGGGIRLMSPIISGTGALNANGGTRNNGYNGSVGRIRVEATELTFTGSISPAAFFSAPGLVFLPETTPALRITKIGGQDVSANPTGSFVVPDVTIEAVAAINIEIAANNIPVGTTVQLRIISESGDIKEVESTGLAGALEASTATASVTLPHGFSRFFIEATWTP